MKWNTPRPNDTRIKSWFAIMPVTVRYDRRWLQFVSVQQEWQYLYTNSYGDDIWVWKNMRFIDPESIK